MKMLQKINIILLFSFQVSQCTNMNIFKYSKTASQYINSAGISYTARSASDCCQRCSKQTGCSSTNYNHHTKVCELLTVHPSHYGLEYVPAADWSVYYKTGVCADTWILYRSSCYYFNNVQRTWSAALDYCANYGADLVEISDAEESDFVYQNAQSIGLDDYWIGLTDAMDEGNFQWLSGEPVQFTNFKDGEPNNGIYGTEHCIGLIGGFNHWNDYICSNTLATVCESNNM